MMVVFHVVFDLVIFFGWDKYSYREGFWFYEGRVAAIIFILLVGVASSLVNQRYDHTVALQKNSLRGLRLIGLGLIITVATYFLDADNMIWFGILHFLGLSILISIPLNRFKWLNVALAVILLAAYYPISSIQTDNYFGLIFGILPPQFGSYDHYALIPWLGYVLIGIALGNWIYPKGKALISSKPGFLGESLSEIGRYSLWIYLLHQPIILGALYLML